MIAFFRLALVAMLLAGIAGLSAILTMQFAVHRTEVLVPELQGLPVSVATAHAAALGLDLSVTERFYSAALPAGRVLLQTPAAGVSVRRGWDLAVAESLGPRQIAIPDVTGRSERDALLLLRSKGLALGAIARLPDARVVAGTVLAQDPDARAKGAAQPRVSLLIADAALAETVQFAMPDETGKLYAQAAAELSRAGLHVQSSLGAPAGAQVLLAPGTPPGTVVAQNPAAGAKVDSAAAVLLFVAGQGAAPAGPAAPGSSGSGTSGSGTPGDPHPIVVNAN